MIKFDTSLNFYFKIYILIILVLQLTQQAPGDSFDCSGGNDTHLKIDINYDQLSGMNANLRTHIEQVMKVSQKFFEDLICIEKENLPSVTHNQVNYAGNSNYDMVIFVEYDNNKEASYVAYASAFGQKSNSQRPFYGLVNINEAHYIWDPITDADDENTKLQKFHNFEYNLETILHEIFHVLGLSSNSFNSIQNSYDMTANPNTASNTGNSLYEEISLANVTGGGQYYKIKTEYVLHYANLYFNYGLTGTPDPIEYVPFENEGGSGSQGAHWERLTIRNEFMTASTIQSDAAISNLSLAFLKDLNWYKDINIDGLGEDCEYWGRGKGKAFIDAIETATKINDSDQTCAGNPQYREFNYQQQQEQCDFYHFGFGPSAPSTFSNGCYIQQIYNGAGCTNPLDSTGNAVNNFEKYGPKSKCFNSDFGIGSNEYRCYQYYCLPSDAANGFNNVRLVIQFLNSEGNEEGSAICESNVDDGNNITDTPPGLQGTYLQCPQNIKDFCNYPVPCENYCSQNGFCIRKQNSNEEIIQSICHCIDGFGGKDCSFECQNGMVYEEVNAQGNYVYVCKDGVTEQAGGCQSGFTAIPEYNFCQIGECNQECTDAKQICSGSVSSCVDCPSGQYYYDKNCLSKCPYMYIPFQENGKSICKPCTGSDPQHCLENPTITRNSKNILQISYEGVIKNICSTGFNANSAQKVCQEMSFTTFKSFELNQACENDKGFWISSLSCEGSGISDTDDCSKNFDPKCTVNQCVKIECQNNDSLKQFSTQYYNGQVLIYYNNQWGGICAQSGSMSTDEYDAICKSMGKDQFDYDYNIKYGNCPATVHFSQIQCSKDQELKDCTRTVQNDSNPCNPSSCADFKCVDSTSDQILDGITDTVDQAQAKVEEFLSGLDAIYIILGSLFGSALISIFVICCVARKCMPQGKYEILEKKEAQKADLDMGEDYHK